jgi:ribosomal-protein-alanine N-acetyltransferase
MGNRGRFGKYGEKKRIDRLRQAKIWKADTPGKKGRSYIEAEYRTKKQSKGSRCTIRPAGPFDVNYIRALSKRVFRTYGAYEELLPHWFESGITLTSVALMDKRPAGFIMLSQPDDGRYFPNFCELLAIAVEPAKQRRGIGDVLMTEVERTTKKLGLGAIVLHTDVENTPARNLFENHGFVSAEIKKNFYPEGQDALMMYKNLSPDNT